MAALFASVDIGGTNIACAVATSDGRIVAERSIPTRNADPPQVMSGRIAATVRELGEGATPAALGAGVPGLLDLEKGHTLFLPNFPGKWRGVPLGPMLSEQLGCPVYLLNDVRIATLGEQTYGLGRGVRNMVFFAVGTGIGGGIVVNGSLVLGPFGAAGEIGHQTIMPDGPECGCGNPGCIEALASGPAIAAEGFRLMRLGCAPKLYELTGGNAEAVTTKEMGAAAAAGDSAIERTILRAAEYLGIGVANMVTALHPELVVLGGGVPAIGSLYIERVRETVLRRVRMFPPDGVRIERSELEDKAGLYGGIALAVKGGLLQEKSCNTLTTTSQR
jgi:glucokinase